MATSDNKTDAVDAEQVAPNLADLLTARRTSLGWTLGRIATRTGGLADVPDLERLEAGDTGGLDRDTLHAIARAYDLDIALLFAGHEPVRLGDGYLAVGDLRVSTYSGHIDDVLVAYLELLRTLRGDIEGSVVSFRRVDVEALADGLGYPGEAIVGRLAVLIGARGLRQAAMTGSYASGADMIPTGNADELVPRAGNGPWDDHATTGPLGARLNN